LIAHHFVQAARVNKKSQPTNKRESNKMGARTTYTFRTNSQDLNLYSHYGGEDKAETFARALANAKDRWSDESYFIRIMVSQIVGEDWGESTGFGLGVNQEFEESYSPLTCYPERRAIDYQGEAFSYPEFIERYSA